jgi:hypothetical protein
MKNINFAAVLIFCIFFLNQESRAQQAAFQSVSNIGGQWSEDVYSSVKDAQGNIILLGLFSLQVDFNPGPGVFNMAGSTGGRIYLLKLDSQGNFLWAKQFGNNDQTTAYDIAQDNMGNLYVTGSVRLPSDFDPGPNSAIVTNTGSSFARDAFVAKYDANGNFIWVKSYGNTTGSTIGRNVIVDNSNEGIYITGQFAGSTTDFDPGPGIDTISIPVMNNTSSFIHHLDSAGNHLWVKPFDATGSSSNVGISDIEIDHNGFLYLLGNWFGTADFDAGAGVLNKTANGPSGQDIHFGKYDSSMNLIWHHTIGSSNNYDAGVDLDLQPNGDLIITGGFGTTVDFDPGTNIVNRTSNGLGDIFMLRIDNNGNYKWVNTMGGTSNDLGMEIKTDTLGNIYTLGNFRNTVDFDPSSTVTNRTANPNTWSMFIHKTDSMGDFAWVADQAGSFIINPRELYIYPSGELFIAGELDSIYDFDPSFAVVNNQNNGSDDIFIYRLNQCSPTFSTIAQTACDSFFFAGQMRTSSGTYMDTLQNAASCDSIITLNLTINNSSSTSFNDTACVSYFFGGQTLASSGSYTDTLQSANGCDSIVTLHLVINQPSANTISQTACGSFFFNGQILTTSGTYLDTLQNANVCDSILTLQLTINQASSSTLTETACNSYNFNGQILTTSGTYIDTLQNNVSCDSIVTLNLIINTSPLSVLNETACDQYLFAGQTLTSSGTYYDSIPIPNSCDSVVQLNLTINTVNNGVTQNGLLLTAQENGASYQWLRCNPFALINGANAQSYTVTDNGDYAVIVTRNNCTDTSSCFSYTNVSVQDLNAETKITIYPNPVNNELNISIPDRLNAQLSYRLYDASGRTILTGKLEPTENVISLEEVSKGLYFLNLSEENQSIFQQRILKQ